MAPPNGFAFGAVGVGNDGDASGLGVTLGAPERGSRFKGLRAPTDGVGGFELVAVFYASVEYNECCGEYRAREVLCLLGPLLHVSPVSAAPPAPSSRGG